MVTIHTAKLQGYDDFRKLKQWQKIDVTLGESRKFSKWNESHVTDIQIELIIYPSIAIIDEKILFGKITHLLETMKLGKFWSSSILVHNLLAIEIQILFLKL